VRASPSKKRGAKVTKGENVRQNKVMENEEEEEGREKEREGGGRAR